MNGQGVQAYLTRALRHGGPGDYRVEDVLRGACDDLHAISVALESHGGTVKIVAPDGPDAADRPEKAAVRLPVDGESSLVIVLDDDPSDDALLAARCWAGLTKLVRAVGGDPPGNGLSSVLRTLRRALEAIDDEAEAARYVVRAALRSVGGDAAWYAARSPEGLVIRADSGFDDPLFSRAWLLNVGEGVGGRAFTQGQTVIANDYLHDRRRVKALAAMADREGVRSVVIAPVRRRKQIVGALYVTSRRAHMFHEREADYLTAMGEELGHALACLEEKAVNEARRHELTTSLDRTVDVMTAIREGIDILLTGGSLDAAVTAVSRSTGVSVELSESTRETPIQVGDEARPHRRTAQVRGPQDAVADVTVATGSADQTLEHVLAGLVQIVRLHWSNQRDSFRLRRNFLASLLLDTRPVSGEACREGLAVGVDLARPRMVACARILGQPADRLCTGDDGVPAEFERQISTSLSGTLCIRLQGGLAIVTELGPGGADAAQGILRTIVSTKGPGLRVVVGVGSTCVRPGDYARAWREAQVAAQFGEHRRVPGVVPIGELGVFSLFAAADVSNRLSEDVSALLGPLNSLPESLLETLDAYVHCGFSVEDTAKALHIHPNSLRYRIRRINDRFGVDLRHPDQRFLLELGLRARRLLSG